MVSDLPAPREGPASDATGALPPVAAPEHPTPSTAPTSLDSARGRSPSGSPITFRAIFLGLTLIPPNVYWVGMTECIWHGLHFTCLSLAMNVVFLLLILMAINALFARCRPAWMFSQAELLTVFGMLAISSALCGHDRITVLMGVIGHAARFTTPENHWGQLFLPLLPDW